MNEIDRKLILNYKKNFWTYAELLGIVAIIPTVVGFALYFTDFTENQRQIIIICSFVISVIASSIVIFLNSETLALLLNI
ncbi:MAG: hypothetical protein IPQ05_16030 [Leptospiraceae bacterium]|nr:hypothetical protein [Leptospiraceae bacterium]